MSIKIGIGISKDHEPAKAAREAVEQARLKIIGHDISIGFVFNSIDLACQTLIKIIYPHLEGAPLVGCTTPAVITQYGIVEHGVVVILLSLSPDISFNIACIKDIKTKPPLAAGEELGEKLLTGFNKLRRDFGLIFFNSLLYESSHFITGMKEKLGSSFPLAGGSIADHFRSSRSYLYYNQEILEDACLGIIWGGKVHVTIGIKHGWKPLGKPREVTSSTGNVVSEIDNAPAAQVYMDYLGTTLEKLKMELKHISMFYPIGIHILGEEEYILRNIIAIEENGALILQGPVPEKSLIRLMIATKDSCLEAAAQIIADIRKHTEHPLIDGKKEMNDLLFVFNSFARRVFLGRHSSEELEILMKGMQHATPLIGIHTYGELAPLQSVSYQGQTYFHNQTIELVHMNG